MTNVAKLKEKARAYEQREQWKSALEVYEGIVRDRPTGEDVEVAIWNRIGDLSLRVGRTDRAITAYEHAIQAYEEAGLHNNAIALCNKVLRVRPGRAAILLRLAVISAAKGFLADARGYLQQYTERMRSQGLEADAIAAIRQAAQRSVDETEVRAFLLDQLRLLDPPVESRTPDPDPTPTVRPRMAPRSPAGAAGAGMLPDLVPTAHTPAAPPSEEPARGLDIAPLVEGDAAPEFDPREIAPLAGLQTTHSDDPASADTSDEAPDTVAGAPPLPGIQHTSLRNLDASDLQHREESKDDEGDEPEPIPLLGDERLPRGTAEPSPAEPETDPEEEGEPLTFLFPGEEEPGAGSRSPSRPDS